MAAGSRMGCAGTVLLGAALAFFPHSVRWDAVKRIETLHRADRLYVSFERRTFVWRGSLLRGAFETWVGAFRGRLERKVDYLYQIDGSGVHGYHQEQLPNVRLVPIANELFAAELAGVEFPFYWKWDGSRFVRLNREESVRLRRRMISAYEAGGVDDLNTGTGWKRADWLGSVTRDYRVGDRVYRLAKSTRRLGKGARFTRLLLTEPGTARPAQVLLEAAEFRNRYGLK